MAQKVEFEVLRQDKLFSILQELKEKLIDMYGARIKELILYGSYARGDANGASDIDLLMVLDDYKDSWEEEKRIEGIVAELCLKYDVLLVVFPVKEEFLNRKDDPFIKNILKEEVIV